MKIIEKDLPYIFDRFYKADESRTGSGNGLGLSIASILAKGNNTIIKVNSQKDKGSTFSIIFI